MSQKRLLYVAAFFTFFTFMGHSAGTLLPTAPPTEAIGQAQALMESTLVEMPFGPPRSLGRMAYGGNAYISLYLLLATLIFIVAARSPGGARPFVGLNSWGLLVGAVFALVFFFPLPAICMFLASALGFVAVTQPAISRG